MASLHGDAHFAISAWQIYGGEVLDSIRCCPNASGNDQHDPLDAHQCSSHFGEFVCTSLIARGGALDGRKFAIVPNNGQVAFVRAQFHVCGGIGSCRAWALEGAELIVCSQMCSESKCADVHLFWVGGCCSSVVNGDCGKVASRLRPGQHAL